MPIPLNEYMGGQPASTMRPWKKKLPLLQVKWRTSPTHGAMMPQTIMAFSLTSLVTTGVMNSQTLTRTPPLSNQPPTTQPSPMPYSPTSTNTRKRNGSSSAPPGLFEKVSSKASSTTYVNGLMSYIIHSSSIAHSLTSYCNITPLQILKHSNKWWCPLDVQAKMILKNTKWDALAFMMTNNKNHNPNSNTKGDGSKDHKSRCPQMKKLRNMGANCHSHSFHPVSANHNSTACSWQQAGHNNTATQTICIVGDTFWSTAKRVTIEQQEHPTWKGKSAPTSWQGLGITMNKMKDSHHAAFYKIKQ